MTQIFQVVFKVNKFKILAEVWKIKQHARSHRDIVEESDDHKYSTS